MTINEAIAKVLTTQYKKDALEAHNLVTSAGYKVSKYDGDWWIENKETHRYVYMTYDYHYRRGGEWYLHTNHGLRRNYYPESKPFPIDFEKMLATPINQEWIDARQIRINQNTAKSERLYDFRSAKRDIEWDKKHIAEAKAKLKELTEKYIYQIEYYTKQKTNHVAKLNNLRKEFGLKPKYED